MAPECPGCQRPMARVAGPDGAGWTCVNCNAAGDSEEDHLEDPADSRPCGCEEVEGLRSELLGARADAAKQFEERMALVDLLGRIVKYAREDRAHTPGTTRLARALAEAEKLLSATAAPAAPVRVHTWCPKCDLKHIDALDEATGIDWATRPHKTHLCLGCGHLWKPHDYATVGVAAPAAETEATAEALTPEPWRVGKRIPEHVYIGDRPLVTMPTAELAALVVTAVNGEAVTALRACQQRMAEALEELNETRWGFGGSVDSMNSWGETIEGRTFKRVNRAREILGGEGGGGT